MCGIAGFYGPLEKFPNKESVLKCRSLMYRRGPDFSGIKKKIVHENKGILILHSRLSIIDPTKVSNQPMENEKGILAFNALIPKCRCLSTKIASGLKLEIKSLNLLLVVNHVSNFLLGNPFA